jgi:hypothetical protein
LKEAKEMMNAIFRTRTNELDGTPLGSSDETDFTFAYWLSRDITRLVALEKDRSSEACGSIVVYYEKNNPSDTSRKPRPARRILYMDFLRRPTGQYARGDHIIQASFKRNHANWPMPPRKGMGCKLIAGRNPIWKSFIAGSPSRVSRQVATVESDQGNFFIGVISTNEEVTNKVIQACQALIGAVLQDK